MLKFVQFAALAVAGAITAVGSVSAAPRSYVTGSVKPYMPSYSQNFTTKARPCVSHEVLDNVRHAFYDSCTGAFIRADVR